MDARRKIHVSEQEASKAEVVELNDEQVARIDEIHNAVMELLRVMTEDPDLEWDMALIGPVADYAADILAEKKHKVRYPAVVETDDGVQVYEYWE